MRDYQYYKLNKWNPLTYVWFVISIPIQMVVSMFTHEDIIGYIQDFFTFFRGRKEYSIPKIFRITGIMIKCKEEAK